MRHPATAMRIGYLVDRFPELTQTFVSGEIQELARLGNDAHVEAAIRAPNPDPSAAVGVDVAYAVDDTRPAKAVALARLVARHPLRCARDLIDRRRWRRAEVVRPLRQIAPIALRMRGVDHIHAHFAMGAALDAMRVGALLGLPYSVMTHGFDMFKTPANLTEKLERAAFAASPSAYSTSYLRELAPKADIHTIVMGVDGQDFTRDRPHPAGRVVVAVARLVEKKGLIHLVEAAQRLGDRVERVVIVGDGPFRDELRGPNVELVGPKRPEEVKRLMQDADVLAMPCVIAADGDRDTMPVVVKEALALEMPVVASDAVGLPEMVRPEWGRLVPPGDPDALAAALDELLSLPPAERARMGRAGRAFVLEHCSRAKETARLAELFRRDGRCR